MKRCYRTTNFWYAKLAPRRRKHFIEKSNLTPRQPIPAIQIKPREWKPDPEVILKHDDLYARSWECEYEKSTSDSDYSMPVTPSSLKTTVQREVAADETSTNPGTIREISLEFFPQVDGSCDGTDTDHYMEPDAYTTVEQPDPTPTNPHSPNLIYVIP